MPILTLNELNKVERGPAHKAFGSAFGSFGCGPYCSCGCQMAGDTAANIKAGKPLDQGDISYIYSVCASKAIKDNPNISHDDLVSSCKDSVPYGPGFQAAMDSIAMPANNIAIQTIYDQTKFTVGQINLDLFGQILKNYSSYLTSDERDLLNNLFINWHQSLTADEVTKVMAIMQRLANAGIKISPSASAKQAAADLQAKLPDAGVNVSAALADPVGFYNNVLASLHTITTSTPNLEAEGYLPAQQVNATKAAGQEWTGEGTSANPISLVVGGLILYYFVMKGK